MFERDCDETKIWIHEKLKAASDEGYLVSVFVSSLLITVSVQLSPTTYRYSCQVVAFTQKE